MNSVKLTIFLTCSGVRGDLGRTPGRFSAADGGVDGLSVAMSILQYLNKVPQEVCFSDGS